MQQMRGVREWCALVALAGVVGACETARNPGGVLRDQIPPTITLSAASDTQQISSGLSFTVVATDNLGLKDIRLTYSDPSIAQSDSIFNTAVTSFNQSEHITFPPTSGAGGFITIIGRATDGAGNFAEDTIVVFLSNVQALSVTLLAPTPGALASPGRNLQVQVRGQQIGGLQRVGYERGGDLPCDSGPRRATRPLGVDPPPHCAYPAPREQVRYQATPHVNQELRELAREHRAETKLPSVVIMFSSIAPEPLRHRAIDQLHPVRQAVQEMCPSLVGVQWYAQELGDRLNVTVFVDRR